jgi:hypothetical protein
VAASTDAGVVAGFADTQIDLSVADAWAYDYARSCFENRFRGCAHIGAAPRKRGNLRVELRLPIGVNTLVGPCRRDPRRKC